MVTSPAAVNEWGTADSIWVSETLKRVEPASVMLSKFVTLPLVPIFIPIKSPVAVVDEPGFQLKYPKNASPAVVNDVAVVATSRSVPVVRVFELPVFKLRSDPVCNVEEVIPNTSPVVVTSLVISATPPAAVSTPYAINDADEVAVPPTATSYVEFPGDTTSAFNCQSSVPPPVIKSSNDTQVDE